MQTLKQFASKIKRTTKRIEKNANKIKQNSAKAGARVMIFSTPVLTGRARGGWLAGDGVAEGPTPLDKGGGKTNNRVIQQINLSKPGADLHVVNNVIYIESLDMGTSRKSPEGMTRGGIRAIRQSIAQNKIKLLSNK